MFNLPRSLAWTMRFLVSCLLVFTVCRLLLWVTNFAVFKELSGWMVAHAFLHGVRFDLSILLMLTGLPLFFLALPIRAKWYFRFWSLLAVILALAMFFALISDVVYFQQTANHLSDQVLNIGEDIGYIVKTAFITYWYWMLGYFIVLSLLLRATWNFAHHEDQPFAWWGKMLHILITLLVLWMGINGKVGLRIKKVTTPADAFAYSSMAYGQLVLNGPFNMLHSVRYARKYKPVMAPELAAQTVQAYLAEFAPSPEAAQPDPEMLLGFKLTKFNAPDLSQHRHALAETESKGNPTKRPSLNVLIILIESLDGRFLGSFQELGYEDPTIPAQLTPNLDRIARAGIRVKEFYPNTGMSFLGIESILTGMPALPAVPSLGHGLEFSNPLRLGEVFQRKGYTTFFAQSAYYDSFRLNSVVRSLGMQDSLAKENYPHLYAKQSTSNGWDGELLAGIKDYLAQREKKMDPSHPAPFFGLIFTGTMHIPYLLPDDKYAIVPHDESGFNGMLNTTHYTDAMLGDFMAAAEKQDWFKDTLFIITADHRLMRNLGDGSAIPLIFYAPAYLKPQVIEVLSSQVDLIPTLFDFFRWEENYAGLGRSIFAPGPRLAVQSEGSEMALLQGKAAHNIALSQGKLRSTTLDEAATTKATNFLLALQQEVIQLVKEHRVCPNN
ncbi:MAG: sulfatase-like hydrolase/transferase [Bacteriovoracaceae bacterium]|nr:sulfatase-like hydrolase/transferase [Bacteriovoracaceae bacterium]